MRLGMRRALLVATVGAAAAAETTPKTAQGQDAQALLSAMEARISELQHQLYVQETTFSAQLAALTMEVRGRPGPATPQGQPAAASATAAGRRNLNTDMAGLSILRDNAGITMGAAGDVKLYRSGDGEVGVMGDLAVSGSIAAESDVDVTGSISAASVDVAGTATVSDVAASGSIVATDVTASGTMSAGSVSATGTVSAETVSTASVEASGSISAGSVDVSGTVSAATVSTASVEASGSISAGSLDVSGSVSVGALNADSLTVSGGAVKGAEGSDGSSLRICVGQSSHVDWSDYSTTSVYQDISIADCGFANTPEIFTSMSGSSSHWQISGISSIYSETSTNFRVYLYHPSSDIQDISSTYSWSINWMAVGT